MRIDIVVRKDAAGEWRWTAEAGNGRAIADSAEGYKERRKALRPLYMILGLPEPKRMNGFYRTVTADLGSEVEVHVKLGKNGHPVRVEWRTIGRRVRMDVIA